MQKIPEGAPDTDFLADRVEDALERFGSSVMRFRCERGHVTTLNEHWARVLKEKMCFASMANNGTCGLAAERIDDGDV